MYLKTTIYGFTSLREKTLGGLGEGKMPQCIHNLSKIWGKDRILICLKIFSFLLIENTYISCGRISEMSNELGRIDNFRVLERKLSFLPTELDIFDIQQHYVRILFIFQLLTCFIISNTDKHEFNSL